MKQKLVELTISAAATLLVFVPQPFKTHDGVSLPETAIEASTIEKPVTEPLKPVEPLPVGGGDCAYEITKYGWNQTVAYNVMMVESGNNPLALNDNPRTGDYSVGCFQVNLYGNLRNTRPSEEWLKTAANNVAYAYQLYQASGWGPWSFTTCKKVACY